ncbi:MAG: tRNA pseudouridine(38-40) synthase TruA [Nitrospira sp.]|nr:tRNA pseudouridine(38-40) synthase TruA [Nitrospira sp.]
MPTFKLVVEYDGTGYAGWQRQLGQPTVQAALENALQKITQTSIAVIGAGRTDAGVHALGQVVSFRSDKPLTPRDWRRALNAHLPADISVQASESVPDDFHARYSAKTKQYEYRILNQPERPALDRNRVWHIYGPLHLDVMRQAATFLVGKQDFGSFQGNPTDTTDTICELQRLDLVQEGPLVRIQFLGDRFLKQMVRAIVGTLVEIGQDKRPPEAMKEILAAKDRRAAGYTAPPQGLYLVRVDYN